jgi:hypothetical protein
MNDYSKDVKKAIIHVRLNIDMDDVERAMTIIDHQRCPLYQADPSLDCQIYDLMEEYGQDNDLPEGWWMSEIDEDEILFNL